MMDVGILDSADAELIEVKRFYFEDGNRRVATCHLRMLKRGNIALVILGDRPDNAGMSITNAAEQAASAVANDYQLAAPSCLWVEHYPDVGGLAEPARWAVVNFEWAMEERTGTWRARGASWESLTLVEGEQLLAKVMGRGREKA